MINLVHRSKCMTFVKVSNVCILQKPGGEYRVSSSHKLLPMIYTENYVVVIGVLLKRFYRFKLYFCAATYGLSLILYHMQLRFDLLCYKFV